MTEVNEAWLREHLPAVPGCARCAELEGELRAAGGVETPEAAVEALRELRSAIFRITETSVESPDHQLDEIRHAARQGWTPPGGTK